MAGGARSNLDLSVYLVTDSSLVPEGKTLLQVVAESLEGGASIVQLREKTLDTRPFIDLAGEILKLCRAKGVKLLINDRIDVCLAVGADGVHVGQSDMPLDTVRKYLGSDKIIGVTAESAEQAREAVLGGADYLGTAGVFPTKTKAYPEGRGSLGIAGLNAILGAAQEASAERGIPPVPVVAIGGIGASNAKEVLEGAPGLAGIAVVSAIVAQPDAKAATEELAKIIRPLVPKVENVPVGLAAKRSPKAQALLSSVLEVFSALKIKRPLVHSITNFVVMNPNANVLLAIGAAPIMAHSLSEVADAVALCNALVINIGTLAEDTVPSFTAAGKRANEAGVPVVLDPVGAGFTPYRQRTARDLVSNVKLSIIKGNPAEIGFLAPTGQGSAQARGVDSEGEIAKPEETVRSLATSSGATVAMTGAVDYLVGPDGKDVVKLVNGNEWLGRVTGTGCDTAALCGAFAGAAKDVNTGAFDANLVAATGAILSIGIAAEMAVKVAGRVRGPGSFEVALFDELYSLTPETIEAMAKIEVV